MISDLSRPMLEFASSFTMFSPLKYADFKSAMLSGGYADSCQGLLAKTGEKQDPHARESVREVDQQ